ncbi:ribosomal-protein-alanine N-acetyltransferase [Actinomyces denticolens]|nr:ribosomal-protein-alanine N-acetyltransferase [Actinomyces denticolens]
MLPGSMEPPVPPAPPGARLREMRADDLDAVAALETELFGGEAWSPALLRAELAAAQGEGADRHYVVVEDGDGSADSADSAHAADSAARAEASRAILGYAGLWFGDGRGDADLLTIATAERSRRLGLARAMLDHLLARARDAGCGAVLLEVRASNGAAQALYRSLGFAPIGRRRRYYSAPAEDAVVMRLVLAGPGHLTTGGADRPARIGPVGSEAV